MIRVKLESGYYGYSMSNNAVDAYESGEKPLSKWTKTEIIAQVKQQIKDEDLQINFYVNLLNKVSVNALRDYFLRWSSWHHTSSMYNRTEFFSVSSEQIEALTDEELNKMIGLKKQPKEEPKKDIFIGDIYYLEWEGTKKHPKPVKKEYTDVKIELRGCFYYVYDDNGREILKKKTDSNGTRVVRKEQLEG